MNKPIFTILFLSIILTGCGTTRIKDWTPRQQNTQAIWADDSTEIAVIELSFEEKSGSGNTTDKRNFKHQIFAQMLDGSQRRPITQIRDGQDGRLFYMKHSGYLVMEALLVDGKHSFDKISLSGKEILIIETPDANHQPCKNTADSKTPLAQVEHTVIPSPDGKQLAHVYSSECGKVSVEFLYANNLNTIDSPNNTIAPLEIERPVTATWHRDGYVILAETGGGKAWKVSVQETPTATDYPNCLTPVTTSSSVSLDGRAVSFDAAGKLATKNVDRQKETFGCQ